MHPLDVPDAVLQADDPGQGGDLGGRLGGEPGGAPLVEDDGQIGGRDDLLDVPHEALLRGADEIGRQQQDAVGARAFDAGGLVAGDRGGAAGRREYRHPSGRGRDGDPGGPLDLLGRQRVELTGAAGDEHTSRARGDTRLDVLGQPFLVQRTVRRERRDREEQHSVELHVSLKRGGSCQPLVAPAAMPVTSERWRSR